MGSQVKIGDRIFNALGKGRLAQEYVSKEQIRWVNGLSSVALTALGNTATFAASLAIVQNNQLIRIKNIICIALFVDSSTGATYNVSDQVNLYLYTLNWANLDNASGITVVRLPFQSSGGAYDILAQLNAGSIAIDATVYGGDVSAKTLITPAAGDQIQFSLSVVYEPL